MHLQGTHLVAVMLFVSFLGGVCGGALVTSPTVTVRAQGAQVVTATQVNVVDQDGRLRAVLAGQDERRMASLSFYDTAGQVRGIIGIDEDEMPLVKLFNQAGQSRLSALVQGDNGLVITGDEDAHSGVFGTVGSSPLLSFLKAGRNRLGLQLAEDGSPSLRLFDGDGRQSIGMTVDPSRSSLVTFHDQGQLRAAFGVQEQTALLNLADTQRMRLVIGVAQDGNPSVSFFSESGQLVQELPLELAP
jgi:hypothetical protein